MALLLVLQHGYANGNVNATDKAPTGAPVKTTPSPVKATTPAPVKATTPAPVPSVSSPIEFPFTFAPVSFAPVGPQVTPAPAPTRPPNVYEFVIIIVSTVTSGIVNIFAIIFSTIFGSIFGGNRGNDDDWESNNWVLEDSQCVYRRGNVL